MIYLTRVIHLVALDLVIGTLMYKNLGIKVFNAKTNLLEYNFIIHFIFLLSLKNSKKVTNPRKNA